MPEFSIGKTKIFYEIKENTRSQRMRLTILGDKVYVRGPSGITENEAEDLLMAHQSWIYMKLREAKENPTIDPWPDRFIPGAKVLWKGRWEHIRSCEVGAELVAPTIEFNQGFHIMLPIGDVDRKTILLAFEAFFNSRSPNKPIVQNHADVDFSA